MTDKLPQGHTAQPESKQCLCGWESTPVLVSARPCWGTSHGEEGLREDGDHPFFSFISVYTPDTCLWDGGEWSAPPLGTSLPSWKALWNCSLLSVSFYVFFFMQRTPPWELSLQLKPKIILDRILSLTFSRKKLMYLYLSRKGLYIFHVNMGVFDQKNPKNKKLEQMARPGSSFPFGARKWVVSLCSWSETSGLKVNWAPPHSLEVCTLLAAGILACQ